MKPFRVRPQPEVEVYDLKKGERAPLIGVHGSGGILFFGRLARHIAAEQPFHVVQGKGLDRTGRSPPFASIHELADASARRIAELAAGRRVFLCGRWAPIVLETGRRLVENAQEVPALIMFDAGPTRSRPDSSSGPRGDDVLARSVRLAARAPLIKPVSLQRFETTVRLWCSPTRRGRARRNPFRAMNWKLTPGYVSRRFPGKIVLIKSQEYAMSRNKTNQEAAWRSLSDEFEVHVAAGGHVSMWVSPNIEKLGALVQRILDGRTDPRFIDGGHAGRGLRDG